MTVRPFIDMTLEEIIAWSEAAGAQVTGALARTPLTENQRKHLAKLQQELAERDASKNIPWDEFNAYARELGRRAGKRHVPPKTDEQADHDWHRYCDEWTVKED